MITKFKIFESVSVPYKDGDFALVRVNKKGKLRDDILAEIIKIDFYNKEILIYIYDDDFDAKKHYRINFNQMVCWSENREELEQIINMNKYNL